MHYFRRKGWELPERDATPESLFLDRRAVLRAGGALIGGAAFAGTAFADTDPADPSAGLYPAKRSEAYKLDRSLTPETDNTHYNNFYEFGQSKSVSSAAQSLKLRPWTVKIDGMVEAPKEVAIDDLLKAMPLEERLYRHRCVEAWSMTVPWTGFSLKSLVDYAKPMGSAKYVRFETFLDAKVAPGQKQTWFPWPYVEGLTIAEATNDLAFMVTGAYGKPLPKVMGAPLRLATPWKYGFKSIKSITKISFTDQPPKSYWEQLASDEYGFWANVNPAVPHPRWSQATEQVLGKSERVPTLIYNGYGAQVASLYAGMKDDRLFM